MVNPQGDDPDRIRHTEAVRTDLHIRVTDNRHNECTSSQLPDSSLGINRERRNGRMLLSTPL